MPTPTARAAGDAAAARPAGPRFGWRHALAVYLVFAAGVVAATWPLARDPGALWPRHHDPWVFTWVMASIARRLLSDPLALFHGNAFYPYGESLAFTEVLLPPALLGLPGFLWGNPVLTYNLLLLLLWPLDGLAMAWVAHALTGSRAASWLAGAVFCLSPYFTDYYLEFQMLLAAPIPIALFAWVRWLETQRPRWLAGALAAITVQALTTWYYAIITGLGFVTLALGVLCLRWRGWLWRRNLVALAGGAAGVAAIVLPFALPYIRVHRELGFERGLGETASHYADLAAFIEAGGRSPFFKLAPSGHIAETTPFVGAIVLALAGVSLAWLWRTPAPPPGLARLRRAGLALLVATLVGLGLTVALAPGRFHVGPLSLRSLPAHFLDLTLLVGCALLLLRGAAHCRAGGPRALGRDDWVRLLLLLVAVFAILALGPVIHVARQPRGPGPYLAFYHLLLPLHVVRVTVRFAVLTVFGLALLAALGLALVEARLRARPALRWLVLVSVFLVLGLEYAVTPVRYQRVRLVPRPVDAVVRADPEDVAVLEWPTNRASADADAMVRSLFHGKRVVNGLSGFVPSLIGDLSDWLTRPGPPFPSVEAQAALRRIYPLRYLVVRLRDEDLPDEWPPVWRKLRDAAPAVLRFKGTFGPNDLYEVAALPERGTRLERWVSYDYLRRHPLLRVALRPQRLEPGIAQWAEVLLNDRPLVRVELPGEATEVVPVTPPFRHAAPNVIAIQYGYQDTDSAADARYRIGTTGVRSPGALQVVSGAHAYGNTSVIRFHGSDLSPNRRGYNLVALDPDGRFRSAAAFDTFDGRAAAGRLAAWVAALPAGTIVAGSVKDEASERLSAEAVAALRTLGVSSDLRGRYRESHAFVGVKGAPPGSAAEAAGSRRVEVLVGRARPELGVELTAFALLPPAAAR